jgi:spore maturation protein CgeB
MKLVIFGLTVSSSWGNGHATLWRGLWRALAARGHQITFFEKDVPYYAAHRDLTELPGGELILYPDWEQVLARAQREIRDAEVAMVTSYCPDGLAATDLVLSSSAVKVFYDLDTPVTLENLRSGRRLGYIGPSGLCHFDLVLSYTGGRALGQLRSLLSARRVETLYGHVDPEVHRPVPPVDAYRSDLSYLGTYAADRQDGVEQLFIEPARQLSNSQFLVGGAQYPAEVKWPSNTRLIPHVPPPQHPAFYCSSRLTLSVTRRAMADNGYCPSGRLFEAAACGCPWISDWWTGLDTFFEPGSEILVARKTQDVVEALQMTEEQIQQIAASARDRVLAEHTSEKRAQQLERVLDDIFGSTVLSTEDADPTADRSVVEERQVENAQCT